MSRNTDFVASLVDDKTDPALGAAVRDYLHGLGLENTYTPHEGDTRAHPPIYQPQVAFNSLENGIRGAYQHLGLDVERDPSIQDTPRRFAKMFVGELTKGLNYDFFPKCTATPNGLAADGGGGYDQMVLVKNITTVSLCEHHLQTIDGFTHIAYIPHERVLGLSKFARVVEFFAARPQIQERMTEQVFAALEYILGTSDIAVVQDSVHFCMRARGVRQQTSSTVTDKMGGRFLSMPSLRQEFLNAIKS